MKEVRTSLPSLPPSAPRLFPYTHRFSFSRTLAFWRDDRLQQLMPVLVALIPHARTDVDQDDALPNTSGSSRDILSAGLVALCDATTDDTLLKRLNLDVLMHTRADSNDDVRVRIFALQCARALWTAHGTKLIGEGSTHGEYVYCQLADNNRPRFHVGDGNLYRRMRRG
jgi:U3 small nucleolar RNA-associated protein 10